MTKQELLADGLERVSDTARRLGVSRNTIYQWVREGRIAHLRIHDCLRIPTRAVDQMIENGLFIEQQQSTRKGN
jgi:excisionase family DNA binding protein